MRDTIYPISPINKNIHVSDKSNNKISLLYLSRNNKLNRSERFYNNLAKQADKNIVTRGLSNIILSDNNKNTSDTLSVSLSILPFVSYKNHIIRNIRIEQLNVFGASIDDPTRAPTTWLGRTGNKMHFQSRTYLIENNFLFKENDKIDPIVLADNERIIRDLPYLEDARIIIQPINNTNDSVDILVLTKDVWSNAFDLKINDIYSGTFELWDRNIFGFGHQIQNKFLWDSRVNPSSGYNGIYSINNIDGTFINSKINYYTAFDTKSIGIDIQRSFFTPNIKYAGGYSFVNTKTRTLFKDSVTVKVPLNYNSYDGWIGRSFSVQQNNLIKVRQNITITARIMKNYFSKRPKISENSYYNFQNKTLFLGSVAYTKLSYFKSNFIYNFGRTEDIPIGGKAALTLGTESNEFFHRQYGGLELSMSNLIWNFGYIYASVNLSSFFDNNYKEEQGLIKGNFNYFSPLILTHRYRLRHFLNIDFTYGSNRFTNEYLTINQQHGITGLMNDSAIGNTRLNLHWESVCFTPWHFFDFRFVVFAFTDVSWIAPNYNNLFDKFPYNGIGLGIRIRNERLVFNTLQIRFTFYPNLPSYSRTKVLELSGESVLHFPSFIPSAPQLVTYE
jgi:hypothetical protein